MSRKQLHTNSYERIDNVSQISLADLSTSDLQRGFTPGRDESHSSVTLGKPRSKRLFEGTDILALVISLSCAVAATCVISPQLPVSWYLASVNQIVVLGFLLGVMAQCTQTVVPTAMLVLEARFGSSRLQNYEAILRGKFTAPQTSFIWRSALLLTTILPLGLGVAYKRFLGGHSIVNVQPQNFGGLKYGLSYPSLGDLATMNNSVYGQISCNAGFYSRSANDSLIPSKADYPVAFGYNALLLHEEAAAFLDMQNTSYLAKIQDQLRSNESWTLSATVNAFVARRNRDLEEKVKADSDYSDDTGAGVYMNSFWMYDGNLAMSTSVSDDNRFYMLGVHNMSSWVDAVRLNYYDPFDVSEFRQNALIFNLTRETCKGTWEVTKEKVSLRHGSCDETSALKISQNLFNDGNNRPFSLDTLPVLVHALSPFDTARQNSPWRIPAYAVSAASAYWARAIWVLWPGRPGVADNPDIVALSYNVEDEHITSTVGTLRASWLLITVLWLHPLIAFTALLVTSALYHVPIGQGFGLVSVLAGIDIADLHLLRGAALSGQLSRRVNLGFHTDMGKEEQTTIPLRYSLHCDQTRREAFRLRRRKRYR